MPAYLAQLEDGVSLGENVRQRIFAKGEPLASEVQLILQEELREPATYVRVLEALVRPAKVVDIAHQSGVEAKDIPKYLGTLQRLGCVRRIRPITEPGGKKSLYALTDGFFAFWLQFVLPLRSELELGRTDGALERLRAGLDTFLGRQFEAVAEEALRLTDLPFQPQRVGTWWGHHRVEGKREEAEIDLVLADDRRALFAEAKWSDLREAEARRILEALREKAKRVELKRTREWLALVARRIEGKDALRKGGFLILDTDDIERLFESGI